MPQLSEMTLPALLAALKDGTRSPATRGAEKWDAMIRRISEPSQVCEIEEETFDYFLEVLPPRWMGHGGFAFGEGADFLRLFWHAGGRYYCRQMTMEEHLRFVNLTGIGLSSG